MPTPATAIVEPPIIDDPVLRAALVYWFERLALSWTRQADGLALYGAEGQADSARARAAVCRQMGRDLEDAARMK